LATQRIGKGILSLFLLTWSKGFSRLGTIDFFSLSRRKSAIRRM
jgi:hypothetical protein